jgi:hypothetical protein
MLVIHTNRVETPKKPAEKRPTPDGLPPLEEGEIDFLIDGMRGIRTRRGTLVQDETGAYIVEWNDDIFHDDLRAQLTEEERESLADAGLGNTELAGEIKRYLNSGMAIKQVADLTGKSEAYVKQFSSKLKSNMI